MANPAAMMLAHCSCSRIVVWPSRLLVALTITGGTVALLFENAWHPTTQEPKSGLPTISC